MSKSMICFSNVSVNPIKKAVKLLLYSLYGFFVVAGVGLEPTTFGL